MTTQINALNAVFDSVKRFMKANPPPWLKKGEDVSLEKIIDDLKIEGNGITIELIPKKTRRGYDGSV